MKSQPLPFTDAEGLDVCIKNYFSYIEGEYRLEEPPAKAATAKTTKKSSTQKIWTRLPEPPTWSGLAYFLGFESCSALEARAARGKFAKLLRRAKLKVEAEYEKKLHYQSSTGAIFALKHMGWQERATTDNPIPALKIKINNTGPAPAHSEQEVVL